MFRKAFSLGELLIVIVIIGIICVLMFSTIKPSNKYISPAYKSAFKNLSDAVYNISEDAQNNENNLFAKDADRYFPGTFENADNKQESYLAAQELCKKLAINPTKTSGKCGSYGYLNTVIYNCESNFKTVDFSGVNNQFVEQNIAFQSTNTMNFYISPLIQISVKNPIKDIKTREQQKTTIKFFIVWVDINGKRRPNTSEWKNKKLPDIVPFIVTTNAEVLPIGYPTTDVKYITALVQYPVSSEIPYSQPKTYKNAVLSAFGGTEYPENDIYSIYTTFQQTFQNSTINTQSIAFEDIPQEELCKLEKNSDIPKCTIVINN